MIRRNEIVPVGNVGKPHGLTGELQLNIDSQIPLASGDCLIFEIDGIFVPFFVEAVRARTNFSRLVKLEDINSDTAASVFSGLESYMKVSHIDAVIRAEENEFSCDDSDEPASSALYIEALIGASVESVEGQKIGKIIDVNDTTANILFEVEIPDGKVIFIPVAQEFIVNFDADNSILTLDLPVGLLESQS